MKSPVPTLKRTAEIREVYKEGKKYFTPRIHAYCLNKKNLKIGISVSRKEGGAVDRNRARRLIKEFFRQEKDSINPSHVMIVLKKPLLNNCDETRRMMLKLLRKVGLIK